MKKIIAMVVALSMLLGLCGVASATAVDGVDLSQYRLVDEPTTLSIISLRGSSTGEPEDQYMWQWLSEITGITFDVEYIDATVWSDKKTITIASGDYPDIFFGPTFTTSEIMRFGSEGIFIDLNDLIDEYGTNIKYAIEELVPEARSAATLPDGSMYTLPYANKGNLVYADYRTWINQTWLDNLGLAMPTTIDEFYTVLKAFKEQDPNGNGEADEIPWSGVWSYPKGNTLIFNAFGFITGGNNMAVKDGAAVYMPLHEDYKLYLEFMHKLYAEGLIDQDIFTQTAEQYRVKGKNGQVGYSGDDAPFLMTAYEDIAFDYVHAGPLTSSVNDTPMYYQQNGYSMGFAEITDNCADPALAIRFLDLLYDPYVAYVCVNGPMYLTEEMPADDPWAPFGSYLSTVTEEDVANGTYVEALLGVPTAKRWVNIAATDNESELSKELRTTVVNPEDLGGWDWFCRYIGPREKGTGFNMGIDDSTSALLAFGIDFYGNIHADPTTFEGAWRTSQIAAVSDYYTHGLPTVWFTSEQQETINELWTPLQDYAKQMEAKFISGAASIDEEYDAFVAELRKLGAEEVQQIYRDATASYFAAE